MNKLQNLNIQNLLGLRKITLIFGFNFLFSITLYANLSTQSLIISSDGLGFIHATTTYATIKEKMGNNYEFKNDQRLLVDWNGVQVKKNGETLFYLAYPSYPPTKKITDNSTFNFIYIVSPHLQTKEHIGTGNLIADAEKIYGEAKLTYHTEEEGREYVRFENGPKNVIFRTGTGPEAGIYSNQNGPDYSTTQYKPDAKIQVIMIRL